MLPQNKKVTFESIVKAGDYNSVVSCVVQHEIHDAMHNGIANIAEYFDKRFSIVWPESERDTIITTSLIRNCIMHNNSIADDRLAARSDWNTGNSITLSVSDVHGFGISARDLLRHIYTQADERHLSRGGGKRDKRA